MKSAYAQFLLLADLDTYSEEAGKEIISLMVFRNCRVENKLAFGNGMKVITNSLLKTTGAQNGHVNFPEILFACRCMQILLCLHPAFYGHADIYSLKQT